MNKLIILLAIILLTSCVSTKEVQKESGINIVTNENFDKSKASKSTSLILQESGICVTTDKTDSEPSIIISSGKCAKDE